MLTSKEDIIRVYGMYIGAEVEYGVMLGDREIYDRGTLIGVTLDEEGGNTASC